MPPVDLVIVSHDHYDHLDYPTMRETRQEQRAVRDFARVGAHLEAWGVQPERIVELDWWESHQLPNTGVTVKRRAIAALFRAQPERPQCDLVVLVRHPCAAARGVLQRRYGPHDGISGDSRTARSVRSS